MVYVQFDDDDEARCSMDLGSMQLAIAGTEMEGISIDEGPLLPTPDAGPYWSMVVDLNDHMDGLPDELDSGDEAIDSSSDESDEDVEDGSSHRAEVPPMDVEAVRAEDTSLRGFGSEVLEVRQHFPDKKAAKHAIQGYGITIGREYRVLRSNAEIFKVSCIHKESGCPTRIVARQPRGIMMPFVVTKMVPHTCEQSGVLPHHRNVTASYVVEAISSTVVDKIGVSVKSLIKAAADRIGYPVSYNKARRAKEEVLTRMFGSYEDAYNYVPRMLHQICETNPGTYISRQEHLVPNGPEGHYILDRVFWAFSQTIQAFSYCRPVLSIDGTFLTGKYTGTLLVAVAADANDQLLLIAYAIVENESTESWLWFLKCLKDVVVRDRAGVCIISDRNAGLLSALHQMKYSVPLEHRWPDITTRWCMRHWAANFYSRFKNKDYMKIFKKMCMQNQTRKFDAIFAALNAEMTRNGGDAPPEGQGEGARGGPGI
ncbi:protein FAR1-RELATED SEQUENCE 6-like [Brachypodium distachyon]|uniref:protein FAR1-RELATED SEQUENCE 6-like n=1 Tax=Brachypodium distachyon TaxID=15368 RepID=UPI000530021B|nr:protein FAR1-RELATED SEQUENCE 6-like [Brachypodium distachyon]|eukprot:XP_010239162.1 protein FAR1-RELATED SEQUENCE 6-like [Brachypodium distachyon]